MPYMVSLKTWKGANSLLLSNQAIIIISVHNYWIWWKHHDHICTLGSTVHTHTQVHDTETHWQTQSDWYTHWYINKKGWFGPLFKKWPQMRIPDKFFVALMNFKIAAIITALSLKEMQHCWGDIYWRWYSPSPLQYYILKTEKLIRSETMTYCSLKPTMDIERKTQRTRGK